MIINENLYNGNDIYVPPNNVSFQFLPVNFEMNFEVGKSYTISFEVSLSEGNSCTLSIFNKNFSKMLFTKICTSGSRNSLTFKFDNSNEYKFAFYAGIAGKTSNIKAYYKNIKIEKGDQMTSYLPNKSKVKPLNQAIFLSRGVRSRKYSQSSIYPRQSSFRKEVAG